MIKVRVEEIKAELERLSSALAQFEGYSNGFVKNVSTEIKSMNSDFTCKIIGTLDNMKDTKAPELLRRLEKFLDSGNYLVKDFKEVDEKAAGDIKLEERVG